MRNTLIKGLTDDFYHDLGCNVDYVAKVIEIGKCTDFLCYEITLSGRELKEFYLSVKLENCEKIKQIIDDYQYIIKAYDW